MDGHTLVRGQILRCPLRQIAVEFVRIHLTGWPDEFRQDCRVVACSGTHMYDELTLCGCCRCDTPGVKAWLAVVDAVSWIERDQDVLVEDRRVIGLRVEIAVLHLNLPRAGAHELFSFDRRERV